MHILGPTNEDHKQADPSEIYKGISVLKIHHRKDCSKL